MKRTGYLLLAIVALLTPAVHGQTILIDDFSDGNDDGWIHVDFSTGQPWGPGIFDASSESYHLATTGVLPAPAFEGILNSMWANSADPLYSNGVLRATLRAENGGTVPGLMMRFSPEGGYIFGMDARINEFFVLVAGPEVRHGFTVPRFEIQPGRDWIMEAGAIGDRITMKVWPAGQREPREPQLSLLDSSFSAGMAGVTSAVSFRAQEPWQNSSTFDDIVFRPAICFLRGDCNDDGDVAFSDAVYIVVSLLRGHEEPGCAAACDANDDGAVRLSDAIMILRMLLLGTDLPLPGVADCGFDPTLDELDCVTPPQACQ